MKSILEIAKLLIEISTDIANRAIGQSGISLSRWISIHRKRTYRSILIIVSWDRGTKLSAFICKRNATEALLRFRFSPICFKKKIHTSFKAIFRVGEVEVQSSQPFGSATARYWNNYKRVPINGKVHNTIKYLASIFYLLVSYTRTWMCVRLLLFYTRTHVRTASHVHAHTKDFLLLNWQSSKRHLINQLIKHKKARNQTMYVEWNSAEILCSIFFSIFILIHWKKTNFPKLTERAFFTLRRNMS